MRWAYHGPLTDGFANKTQKTYLMLNQGNKSYNITVGDTKTIDCGF